MPPAFAAADAERKVIRPSTQPPGTVPVVAAAMGMALSYYTYPLVISVPLGLYFLLGLLILAVAIIGFSRTLQSLSNKKTVSVNKLVILAVAAAVGFSLGIAARRTVSSSVDTGIEPEKVTAVSGILIEDPRSLQGGSGLGTLELMACMGRDGTRVSAHGNVTVFFPAESISRLKEFGRNCEIFTDGTFINGRTSSRTAIGSRGLLFNAQSVHIVKPAPTLDRFRTGLRIGLLEKFQSSQGRKYKEPPVWGGLASALLLGVRDDLDTVLSEGFRDSGCAHILALSGMHLAIISGVLAFLLRRPMGVRWASLVGAVFIILYVFTAGSQPSLVRAAIMYLIGTFVVWGLLKGSPISFLSMAFIIQLIFQSDNGISISFILSYLALLGILTLGEMIREMFRGRIPFILAGGLSASIGAFVFSAPVVGFFFGVLRPIGILAGLLLAPLSSLFMVFSLTTLAVSFLPFPLWDFFDFLLTYLYRILEFLVSLAGRVPGLPVSNPLLILVFSLLFCLLTLFLRKKDNFYRNSVTPLD